MQYQFDTDSPKNKRKRSCGQPLRVLRDDGGIQTTTFKCGDRFCDYCSRVYSYRVESSISSTLEAWEEETEQSPVMLTLTERLPQPAPEDVWFVDEEAPLPETLRRKAIHANLENAWARICDHWARTVEKTRRYIRRRRSYRRHRAEAMCGDPLARFWRDEMRRRLNVAGLDQMSSPFDETWSSSGAYPGYQLPSTDDLTYIWAREVTRGEDGNRWHVHIHCIVPDRQTAELLNAGWQWTREQSDYCQTDISSSDDVLDDACADTVSEYVTQYVTGTRSCAFDDGWSEVERSVFQSFLKGRRLYGSAGAWSNLDVGRRDDEPEHEALAVAFGDLDVWETFGEFYSTNSVNWKSMTLCSYAPNESRCFIGDSVDQLPTIPEVSSLLEQYTNNSENPLGERNAQLESLPNEVLQGTLSNRVNQLLKGDDP